MARAFNIGSMMGKRGGSRYGDLKGGAIDFGVFVEGDKDLAKALKKISDVSARKVMRSAIGFGMTPIRREARRLAPNSIARLIHKRARAKGTTVNGMIYVKEHESRTVKLDGRDVDFAVVANFLEFGSASQNIKPIAFMRRARETKKTEAIERVKKRARVMLEREWQKADKKGRVL